jgi:hypothetical protein
MLRLYLNKHFGEKADCMPDSSSPTSNGPA